MPEIAFSRLAGLASVEGAELARISAGSSSITRRSVRKVINRRAQFFASGGFSLSPQHCNIERQIGNPFARKYTIVRPRELVTRRAARIEINAAAETIKLSIHHDNIFPERILSDDSGALCHRTGLNNLSSDGAIKAALTRSQLVVSKNNRAGNVGDRGNGFPNQEVRRSLNVVNPGE